jgi:hypothetical protein
LSERAEVAYSAQTLAELDPLLGDLAHTRAATPRFASWPRRSAALLVDESVVVGVALVAGLPAMIAGRPAWELAALLISLPLNLAYFTVAHGSGAARQSVTRSTASRSEAMP